MHQRAFDVRVRLVKPFEDGGALLVAFALTVLVVISPRASICEVEPNV